MALPSSRDLNQHEPATVPPIAVVVPIVPIPVVEHGTLRVEDGADRVGICGTGLSPPTPSSVEPMGMPTRPTLDEVAIVGDEADAAG
jgi:hypothetical protein